MTTPRLDHIAFRVKDRHKTKDFFCDALGYRVVKPFRPYEDEGPGSVNYNVECFALAPSRQVEGAPWTSIVPFNSKNIEYDIAPEIFVSDGPVGSVVGDWVDKKGPGVHHMAYQVDDVQKIMNEWKLKGYAEFLSESPLTCVEKDPELVQVFTKPNLTGIIFEFIHRGKFGFCEANVKDLMNSTRECNDDS